MAHESDRTHPRTTMPALRVLTGWTDPVWRSAPTPAQVRETVVRSAPYIHRARVAAAALAATAAVSASAPAISAAQTAGTTPSTSTEDGATWSEVDDEDAPMLKESSKALKETKKATKKSWTATAKRYRISRGDNLWQIAAGQLPRGASDAQVYRYMVKVWDANEIRIGTGDPNLVKVGTLLKLPAAPKSV